MSTVAYSKMYDVMDMIGSDSMDLFKTIQNENPYAEFLRQDFVKVFHDLEEDLKKWVGGNILLFHFISVFWVFPLDMDTIYI